MKTFGLIWADGTKELRSIVLDEEGDPRMDTLEPNPKPEDWQAPQVLPLVKIPKPEGAWEPSVVWFEDRVERQWVAGTPPPVPYVPLVTAEQAVSQYFSAYQIAALQRLEMALLQAGKPLGPKMTAAKTWLETVMLSWAASPTPAPQESFGVPQASFAEASAEAVADLQP
jgi:hypothetical protein